MAGTWSRLQHLFDRALELEEEELSAFLDETCAEEPALRRALESLLEADAEAGRFLQSPLVDRMDGRSPASVDPPPDREAAARGADVTERFGKPRTVPDLGPADRLGPYRVLRRLGEGGMGVVYLAVRDDDTFRRRVVIKLLRPDLGGEDLERRFRTERHILAALDHPHIAVLYDGGTTDDGRPYLVMEYIEGLPVDIFCDERRLTVDERLELFGKICGAVHYAHQNLVVHRDIKPSNILVDADGQPKLLDFGIAKLTNPELTARELDQTATWHRLLTPQYASPEQLRGKLVGTAGDVYSLGVLLFKLLTGRHPFVFEGRSPGEIERLLTEQEPPRPSTVVHGEPPAEGAGESQAVAKARGTDPKQLSRRLSGDLDAVVAKALRSEPQRRYGSVERLAEDLERHRQGLPVEARQGSRRYRLGRALWRHRVAVGAALATLLVVLGFLWASASHSARLAEERDAAHAERRRKEEVLGLFLDVLRVADPYGEGGKELTVQQALEAGRGPLRRRLREHPELLAELLHTTGVVYTRLGLWQEARSDLREALDLRLGLLGEDHRSVASGRMALSSVLAELGELDAAADHASQALRAVRQGLAETSDPAERLELEGELLRALNARVGVLCYAGTYAEAAPLSEEAVTLARGRTDRDLPDAITALELRGSVLLNTDRPADAAEVFEQAIRLGETLHGEDHYALNVAWNNLGSARRRSGDLAGAAEAFRRTLDIQVKTVGEEHPSLAFALHNLANLRLQLEEPSTALDLWSRALTILRREAGLYHPRVLFLELQADRARIAENRPSEVLADLGRRLPEWSTRLGADHPYLLMAERIRAEALVALDRPAEARRVLEPLVPRLVAADQSRELEHVQELLDRLGAPELEPAG